MLFVPGGATNLTIDGGGSTLTFTKWTSAIRAAYPQGLRYQNLFIGAHPKIPRDRRLRPI
jgi:hypothetical protein